MNQNHMERKLNINFSFIQSFYWMTFCTSSGFASVFLLSREFDNREVGIVLALANIFAVVLQPMVASYVNASKHITLKQVIVMLGFVAVTLCAVMLVLPKVFFITAILFILILTAVFIIQPLINSLVFEFVNRGIFINFGITRGIGSVAYAVLSYLLGVLVERFGGSVVPYISVVVICLFLLSFLFVKDPEKMEKEEKIEMKQTLETEKMKPSFWGFLCGILCMFAFHTMFNIYLIHIVTSVGGTSKSMGTAIFLAAILELPVMGMFAFLVKKVRIQILISISAIFFVVKAILAYFATNMAMLYVDQVLQMFGYAVFIPASVYYVNAIMQQKTRLKGQAYITSAMTAGAVVGNVTGGILIDLYGVKEMLLISVIFAMIGCICILLFTEKGELAYEKA